MNKLLLNNQIVPGYNLTVSQQMNIASEDLSGTSSSTAKAENGFKPKTFSITVTIRFKDAEDLTVISQLAEGVKSKGDRTIYSIVHPMARALNVTQVRFSDTFSVQPIEGLRAWTVSFSLAEYNSTAERMEARTASTNTVAQAGTGTGVTDGATTDPAADGNTPQTGFEKVLGNLDSLAGSFLGGGDENKP